MTRAAVAIAEICATMGRATEAETTLRHALHLAPHHVGARNNLGISSWHKAGRKTQEACIREALEFDASYVDAHNNLGLALMAQGRPEDALACFQRALAIDPSHPRAHAQLGLCRLLMGDFHDGWRQFEWRWHDEPLRSHRREFRQPLWLGEPSIAGKTVLLHAEQGFGDTLQFCRYASLIAAMGATVVLEVPTQLVRLLAGLAGVSKVLAEGENLPPFAYHCPLMSLPLALGTTLASVPAEIPYLWSDPTRVEVWRARLGPHLRPRVGLVWSGSRGHKNDHNRSLTLADLAGLISERAQFVSLQNELRPADVPILEGRSDIRHFGAQLTDFAETAALIDLMDLVITVDTAVAHLAGAMGKPVWILLPFDPDWRWMLGREDSACTRPPACSDRPPLAIGMACFTASRRRSSRISWTVSAAVGDRATGTRPAPPSRADVAGARYGSWGARTCSVLRAHDLLGLRTLVPASPVESHGPGTGGARSRRWRAGSAPKRSTN